MADVITELMAKRAQWLGLMLSFPHDGWDGAGDAIARHDRRVRQLEKELDGIDPNWHDDMEPPRRSTDPRKD